MRRYLIFASVGLGLLMYSLDTTAVAVAFPSIMKEFHVAVLWAGWTISVYFISITMSLPLVGTLSDTFGRKRVYLASLAIFMLSSLACGLAPNITALIACRFLQGIGGAAFLPTASGIVSDYFPENRDRVIGLFTSIFPIGSIIGPNLGGWIVSRLSWRYIFYINLPIGLLLMAAIILLLEETKALSRTRVDLGGALFMCAGILFLMVGLNFIGENFSSRSLPIAVAFLLLSAFAIFLFIRQEKKETHPVMDLALIKSTPFLATNVLNIVMGSCVMGLPAFIPLYATSVHKLSTLMSGVIMTPQAVAVIPASAVTSFLLRRSGYRKPMLLGIAVVGFAIVSVGWGRVWGTLGAWFSVVEILSFLILMTGIGMGIMLPATNNACIELAPQKVSGIVGLRAMFRTIGAALGISVITIILHVSASPRSGFSVVFFTFGFLLLCAFPLVFLVPSGRR